MRSILVVGAGGQVGRALMDRTGGAVAVINAAASYTAVDGAGSDADAALAINRYGPARSTNPHGSKI